jgi:hypothetical protein
MPILRILCYNGSLVTWTVVSLTAAKFQSQSHIATDGQSVSKSWCRALSGGSWPDIYYCLTVTLLFFVGHPLWREDGSVFYTRICCWSLPAQSFSGPSPLGLATIFYCLRFETSLFVASYDSHGHGGGIRRRLHMGYCPPNLAAGPRYITTTRTAQITPFPIALLLLCVCVCWVLHMTDTEPLSSDGLVHEAVP